MGPSVLTADASCSDVENVNQSPHSEAPQQVSRTFTAMEGITAKILRNHSFTVVKQLFFGNCHISDLSKKKTQYYSVLCV